MKFDPHAGPPGDGAVHAAEELAALEDDACVAGELTTKFGVTFDVVNELVAADEAATTVVLGLGIVLVLMGLVEGTDVVDGAIVEL